MDDGSLSPREYGWFLGQLDEIFAGDYDEGLYKALLDVTRDGDAYILYHVDRTRRAVAKFTHEYVEGTLAEAERLKLEPTIASVADTVAMLCCLIGLAAGMTSVWAEESNNEE